MATVFIIGAAGKVGSRLAKLLAADGHTVLALHRKPEQADTLAIAGATPVLGDLAALDAKALAALIDVADTVVFAAGAGGAGMDATNAIDGVVSRLPSLPLGRPGARGSSSYQRSPTRCGTAIATKASRTTAASRNWRTHISSPAGWTM